jgi:hypothetical protein
MDVFEYNLWTIARYPIQGARQWYAFCDFVAAVGAGEIVNNPTTAAVSAIQQNPHKLICAVTKLRNSGVELLNRVPVHRLTAPPNHFSSLISTLKVYGARRTADAVKGAAYTFWVNIEQHVDEPRAASATSSSSSTASSASATSTATTQTPTPTPAASVQAPKQLPAPAMSLPVTLGLSAATLAAVYLYVKSQE